MTQSSASRAPNPTNGTVGPSAHRAFSRSLFQAVVGSMVVFSIADQSLMFFVLSVLGVALAWVFCVSPNRPIPRLMINTVLVLVVAIAGIEMLRVGVGVSAFAVFVALLLVVKLMDLRGPRDDGQVIVLCVAILISAVLTSNTLITGVMMVIEIALILRAVVLFQIHTVLRKSAIGRETIHSKARIDIRAMILATGFLCGLFGSVVFIVLPRNIGMQAFGDWGPGRSVSGFSDTVELGRPGLISESSTPVLDITVLDRDGLNIGAENTPAIYLRGAVLSAYDSGRWTAGPITNAPITGRTKLVEPNTTLKSADDEEGVERWDQQFDITMRTSSVGQTYLFTPWKPVEFKVGREPMRLSYDFQRGLFVKDGAGGRLEYTVRRRNIEFDEISFEDGQVRDEIYGSLVQAELGIDPQIVQLANDVLTQSGIEIDPAERSISDDQIVVRVIEAYLRSRYTYSLDSRPVPDGQDATEWFLFDRKAGHCEYFASSLALMARSVGVPARVVTGYVVSDYNTVTGQYVVRQSNAHAWVEAQIAPGVWRTFDGTPPLDFHAIHEPDPSIWRSFSKMYESIEFLWIRSVVGYDSSARQNIMGDTSVDFGLSSLSEKMLDRLAAGRGRLLLNGVIAAMIVFATSMFVGLALLRQRAFFASMLSRCRFVLGRIRYKAFRSSGSNIDPRLVELEKMLSASLGRLGIPKPEWVPLKAHLNEHQRVLSSIAPSTRKAIIDASRVLYSHAFAQEPGVIDDEQLSVIRSSLSKSEKYRADQIGQVSQV